MYRLQFLVLFFAVSYANAGELKLNVHGTAIDGKTIFVSVYSSAQDFLKPDGKAIRSRLLAPGDSVGITIHDVPGGECAVGVFADMNANGKLDSNFMGIPNEPVGVSRNAQGHFGPPKFADAVFQIKDGVNTLDIELK